MKKIILLLILLLTACTPAMVTPIASSIPSIITRPTQSSPTSTSQPQPSPTSTLVTQPICPGPGNSSYQNPPSSMSLQWIKEAITGYLNQGGDPENIANELSRPEYGHLEVQMNRIDINNDSIDELVFSTSAFQTTINNSDGVDSGLWVFQCENGSYKIIYKKELIGGYGHSPRLVAAIDLNNDNRQEIAIRSSWNGSGCLQFFDIISWENGRSYPTRRMTGTDFPCGTELTIGNVDSNGNKEILFEGKSDIRYDSVAGIQRDFVDIYTLNNQVYIPKSHDYFPSPYRVYAIYDAQQALNKGDIPQAIRLYDRAAHDETLIDIDSLIFTPDWYARDWPTNLSKKDHPKEYVSAFALFRLVVLNLQSNGEEKAWPTLKELETNYPVGVAGSELTEAAQFFIEYFKAGESPFMACQSVSSMIEHKYPFLDWHFEWSTWTSFDYTNSTLCPYFSER